MGLRSRRLEGLGCALLLCTTSLLAPPDLQAAEKLDFRISGGNAAETLNEFGRQARVQLLFDFDAVRGLTTRPVAGELEAADALSRMLEGTGLSFEFVKERTVAITRPSSMGRHPETAHTRATAQRTSSGSASSGSSPDHDFPRRPPSADVAQDGAVRDASREVSKEPSAIEEIVVTGTHIRGAAPTGAQLITIERDEIDRSGFSTVHEVIRSLPQNFNGGPTEDTPVGWGQGQESISNSSFATGLNLRGLGSGSTLVLLNGRRVAALGGEGRFTDVSSIPLAAIERIEVLPDGASAIYGADAAGGVVNFVLRRGYRGAESQVSAGSTTDGAATEYRFSHALGTEWQSGGALLTAELYERDALPAHERAQTAVSDLRPFGGDNFDTREGNPGTILIGTQTWAIPAGQDGRNLQPGDLIAGTVNLHNRNEGRYLLPETKRWSAVGSARQRLNRNIELSLDALYSERDSYYLFPGIASTLTVPNTNPFYVNPTGGTDPVRVAYNFFEDLGPNIAESDISTLNLTLGGAISLPGSWQVKGHVGYAREHEASWGRNIVNPTALSAALADPDPETAFNPFADGSFNNPLTLDAIRLDAYFRRKVDMKLASVTADGVVPLLAERDVRLAVGADFREESLASFQQRGATIDRDRRSSRDVAAAYAELLVPIVDTPRARRGLQRLDLLLAARHERYSDFGSATTPRVAVVWSPSDSLRLRSSWSRSFKAPNLVDLDESANSTRLRVLPDPASPTGSSQVLTWSGNSADLEEETATIWSVGADVENLLSGLRLSISYFDVKFENRVARINFTTSFLQQPQFASLVIRDPSPELRQEACRRSTFAGAADDCINAPIAALLDIRLHNVAVTETSGIDLLGSYEVDSRYGKFRMGLNGSYLLDYSESPLPREPMLELLDTAGNPIDLRVRGSVSWSRGGFELTTFLNYTDDYADVASEPDRRVDSWTTVDLQLSYATPENRGYWSSNMSLALSAQNVFDRDPPFLNNPAGIGYDPANADLLGRFLSLRVRKAW